MRGKKKLAPERKVSQKKQHAEGWTQPPQQLACAKPQKEQNSCKQSHTMSQVLMKRLLEIFLLLFISEFVIWVAMLKLKGTFSGFFSK